MRIYNGTNSQVDLPLAGNQRLTIAPKAVSGDIMSSTELLSLLVTSYGTDELALVVSGPFEINLCASIPATAEYVVQSLDAAIQRFNPVVKEEKNPEPEPEIVNAEPEDEPGVGVKVEEVKEEDEAKDEAPFPLNLDEKSEEEVKPAPKKSKKGGKKSK